jgi:hypothetical protein
LCLIIISILPFFKIRLKMYEIVLGRGSAGPTRFRGGSVALEKLASCSENGDETWWSTKPRKITLIC